MRYLVLLLVVTLGPVTTAEAASLAEQARRIGATLAMSEAHLLFQPSQPPSRRPKRRKVLVGTAIGAGLGVAVGAALCKTDCEPGAAAGAVVALGAAGTGIGALFGLLASR